MGLREAKVKLARNIDGKSSKKIKPKVKNNRNCRQPRHSMNLAFE